MSLVKAARKLGRWTVLASVLVLAVPTGQAVAEQASPASVGEPARAEVTVQARADICVEVGARAGFSGESFVMAVAIALAESGCNPSATGPNGPTAGCPNGSRDRGLWQINDCYHPDVSDACAYEAQCNANVAYRLSNGGTNWSPWSTYHNGAYRSRLDEAREAVNRAGAFPADRVNQLNGDGYADLVAVDDTSRLIGYHNGSEVNPDGSPFSSQTWRLPDGDWSGVRHMAAGDINRDGYADLVAAMSDGSLVIYNNGSLVHEGGLPYLGQTWKFSGSWQNVRHLAVADVTDDGYADVVVVDGDGTLVVYANGSIVNPGGVPFTSETYRFGNWSQVRNLVLTDVNHDGAADIVAVDGNGQLFGYHNGSRVNPGGVPFAGETWRIAGSNWTGINHLTAGDINRDGFGDLISVDADGGLSVYNNGSLVNPNGIPYAGRTWHYAGNWNTIRNIA